MQLIVAIIIKPPSANGLPTPEPDDPDPLPDPDPDVAESGPPPSPLSFDEVEQLTTATAAHAAAPTRTSSFRIGPTSRRQPPRCRPVHYDDRERSGARCLGTVGQKMFSRGRRSARPT